MIQRGGVFVGGNHKQLWIVIGADNVDLCAAEHKNYEKKS